MPNSRVAVVTGAFSYIGSYIARALLARGQQVSTLTNHPQRPRPFSADIKAMPYNFHNPAALAASLAGADTLYNTYWIRFPHGALTFEQAVANSKMLFRGAQAAGVRKIVHLSVTQASPTSPLPYFRGKGLVESELRVCGVPYAIIRPSLVFGIEDILVNNIAWLLRRFPVFALPGSGDYKLQPIFASDVAALAVQAARGTDNAVVYAVGPETYTFKEFVRKIAHALGRRTRIVHVPPAAALFCARLVGLLVGDVILTRDELAGLRQNLLVSGGPPTGSTRFSEWIGENADRVGTRYASELARHFR